MNSSTVNAGSIQMGENGILHTLFLELGLNGVLALAAIPLLWWIFGYRGKSLPVLNPKKLTELTVRGRILDFGRRSKELFLQGRLQFQKNPYRINCEWGDVVVLHPDFCAEIRNNPAMNFAIPTSDVSLKRVAKELVMNPS